jgi:hypothetical protein
MKRRKALFLLTSGFIAILAQWGMTADQLLPTLDKINKVADDYAITSQDLVDGLVRSSGAARVLGLSLNETIAILTVMREATGRTGREVGNALNSILAFMQRDVALNAFAREGIAVWADEARTQFRNFIDIFDEVAARWQSGALTKASQDMFVEAAEQAGLYSEELAELAGAQKEFSDLQQRDISQAMAGIYRRNYLLALLQNWSKVQEVLNSQMEAAGYSQKENARTMETLEKQYESLKVAAQELAVAIGDAGLLNDLKEVVEGTRDAITWFNELDPTVRNLIISFTEATIALKLLGMAFRMTGISGASSLLTGWAVSAARASVATRILASTAAGAGAVLTNVGRGLLSFFGGPVGIALTIGTTALLAFTNSAEESEVALERNANAARDAANEIDELRTRYMVLASDVELSAAEQEELRDVTSRLLELVPSAITGFDDMGNAVTNYGVAAEAAAGKVAMLREEHEKFIRAKAAVAESVLPGLRETLEQQESGFNLLAEATRQGPESARRLLLGMTPGTHFIEQMGTTFADDAEVAAKAETKLLSTLESMAETRKQIAEYESAQKAAAGIDTGGGGGTPSPKYTGKVPGGGKKSTTDAIKKQIESLTDAIEQFDLINQQNEAILAEVGSRLNINAAEYEYLTWKMEEGTATAGDYARIQTLTADKSALLRKEQEQLAKASDNYRTEIDALNLVLAEAEKQYEALQAAGDIEHAEQAREAVLQLRREIQQLSDSIAQNTIKVYENKKALDQLVDPATLELYRKVREAQHERDMEMLEEREKAALDGIRKEMEAHKKASEARIQSIQDEIDALDEQNDLLDEQKRLTEAQQALEDAKEKLANVQAEKNTRVFRNGAWEWIANPKDVAEAEEAVKEAEENLADTQAEIAENARRRELQKQLEAEQEAQRIQKESDEEKLKEAEEYWKEHKKQTEEQWEIQRTDAQLRMDAYNEIVKEGLGRAIEKWRAYLAEVLSIQQQTGAPPSGGTGGDSSVPGYDQGGPIYADQYARLHAGEYVLNAQNVRGLGGMGGVERLVANIKMPDFFPAVRPISNNNTTTTNNYDRGLRVSNMNVNLSNVYDCSGLIRNLRQLVPG